MTAHVQVTPGSPTRSVCLGMADLTCNIESTLHDARLYYPRRRGHLNSLANIRFRSESSRERHFCNDGYTAGELDVVVDNFDYVALRDTLWAAKNVMVDELAGTTLSANLTCFLDTDVYLFGFYLMRRQGTTPLVKQGVHFEPPPQTQTRTANNKSPKAPKAAADAKALFARHGSVSFDQASFEYELKNATRFVDLTGNVPSSLEEFRIIYPGTKLHIGAGPEGAAAMWSVKYSYS